MVYQTDVNEFYKAELTADKFKKFKGNNLMNYGSGIVIELQRVVQMSASNFKNASIVEQVSGISRGKIMRTNDQPKISCVLEKNISQGALTETPYNNFSLRGKVFYHQITCFYEIYAPMMAVNETNESINLFQASLTKHKNADTHKMQSLAIGP